MKKKSLIALALLPFLLFGCAKTQTTTPTENDTPAPAEKVEMRVAALKGPTGMGLAPMLEASEKGEYTDADYQFQLSASPDEISPLLAKGELDIAAVPANLAAVLYQNTEGKVQVLGINTLGVLYLLERGQTVNQIVDLKGKTIYASGKGASPEYALRYLMAQYGLNEGDVTIEWKAEHAEVLAALTQDAAGIALLPQPFVTAAQAKLEDLRVAIDLNQQWEAAQKLSSASAEPSKLVTGVLVGNRAYIEQNKAAVDAFLDRYADSIKQVNAQSEQAAALIGKFDIVDENIAKKAIPACNIVWIEGSEMKTALSGYLSVLHEQNPKSVGGALPSDDFYYSR